ncbi:MAG: hypothetical protein OXU24_02570, partial [Gammaproteobacteria bacterium]|nr:hypothetical protein [Gammaproteobacteria bacterium]
MNNRRITQMGMSALAMLMLSFVGVAQAAEILVNSDLLDNSIDVFEEKYEASAAAQEEINRLQHEG